MTSTVTGTPIVFDPAAGGRNSCFDIDKDGDIEFPAGDYQAGTILDDVVFNPEVQWSARAGGDEPRRCRAGIARFAASSV